MGIRRWPAVQIQENEVMQVAPLCYTALAGSGHIPPDDALELQLFELQQKILCQAHSLAKNLEISSLAGHHAAKEGVMSKEALARFKSADVRLLALQWRKAALAEMARAVELDDDQAVQPAGIMKRAL